MIRLLRAIQWFIVLLLVTMWGIITNLMVIMIAWGVSLALLVLLDLLITEIRLRHEVQIEVDELKITFLTHSFQGPFFTLVKAVPGSPVRFFATLSEEDPKASLLKEDHHPNPFVLRGWLHFQGKKHPVTVYRCLDRCPCENHTPHWTGKFYWGHLTKKTSEGYLSVKFSFFTGKVPKDEEQKIRAFPDCSLKETPHVIVTEPVFLERPGD